MNMLYDQLCKILTADRILVNEEMKKHTTFKIGGPADFFVIPKNSEEIKELIVFCRANDIPYYVMGNGSNLLVADKGYRGMIIQTHENMNYINIEGSTIVAGAGTSLAKISNRALEAGLTGFEFAGGIPGSIGGACMMNAGAYGGEMKDVICSAKALDAEGNEVTIPKEEMDLGYRSSVFSKRDLIVTEATICLESGDKEEIKAKMEDFSDRRTSKQPLEYPSAGSTFKRPEGYFAGKLIQDSGLSGVAVGGAMVSEKHNGFVINTGGATAGDVVGLMNKVIKTVNEKFGVTLEPEVKRIGDF